MRWPRASLGPRATAARVWNTIRYLDPSQLAWRVRRRAFPVRPRPVAATCSGARAQAVARPLPKAAGWLSPGLFSCHGATWRVASGAPWRPASMPALDLYHLHYLDDLSSAAILADPAQGEGLAAAWLADNAGGPAEAWHPYPVSRRLINLCKWRLAGGTWSPGLLGSAASHADLLCRSPEYDVRGNHLIANGAALVLAGVVLGGRLADRCRALGMRILAREVAARCSSTVGTTSAARCTTRSCSRTCSTSSTASAAPPRKSARRSSGSSSACCAGWSF